LKENEVSLERTAKGLNASLRALSKPAAEMSAQEIAMLLLMASKSLSEYVSFSNSLVDITTDAYIESKELLAMTEIFNELILYLSRARTYAPLAGNSLIETRTLNELRDLLVTLKQEVDQQQSA
jgi:maltooligosyltrehalose synthase